MVASYNLLAPCFVRPVDTRTGTVQEFAAFRWCDDAILDWQRRRGAITQILTYIRHDCDVICLQEVSSSMTDAVKASLSANYHVLLSFDFDHKRDQNSLMLLRNAYFDAGSLKEHTGEVRAPAPPHGLPSATEEVGQRVDDELAARGKESEI